MTASELNNMPHFNWRDVINAKEDTPPKTIEALDKHFSVYAAPPMTKGEDGKTHIGDIPCLKCGDIQNGGLIGAVLGTGFEWGLVHGEGHCRNCHWPATMYHFVKDSNGEDVITITGFLLQYHPDHVTVKDAKEAA
jgi:hypothetical protein